MDDPTHPGEHEFKQTLHVDEWLPNHEPRKASARYITSHHHLVTVLKLPCWVCGTHDSLETHHRLEWCEANALDYDKVRADYPNADWNEFTHSSDFIDSVDNLMVLCAPCHRQPGRGVHYEPWPLWLARRYRKT